MTLQYTGPISLNDINVELVLNGLIRLSGTPCRDLLDVPIGTISLSNAYGKSRRTSTYRLNANANTVTERDVITFTVITTNVPNYTLLHWMLTPNSVANSVDFTGIPIGDVRIVNNRAVFTLSLLEDMLTEGLESFTISLYEILGTP